jgi:D-amino-acid oxidase
MQNGRRGSAGVVGAGVIGLTTAIVAQAAGFGVTLYSELATMATTSAKAAASVKPTMFEWSEAAQRMLERSWESFAEIAAQSPEAGVRTHVHWEASDLPTAAPWYLRVMGDPTFHEQPEIPGGYPFGWRFCTFFVDTPIFLPWLVAHFQAAGGETAPPCRFASLEEFAALPHDVVFNCTGLGARALCDDHALTPVRGQIAVVGPHPEMDWSIKHDTFYVYPRRDDTVLGGTNEADVWDEATVPETIGAILRANQRILPHLRPSDVRRTYAGLRPYRAGGMRVEVQSLDGKPIVHNYGHGGAGITFSWGSAREAVGLVT